MDISEYRDIVQFLATNTYPDRYKISTSKADRNRRNTFKAKTRKFFLKDPSQNPRSLLRNDLYRIVPGQSSGAKVVLKEQVNDVLEEIHKNAFGEHVGVNRTRDAMIRKYWWFGFTEDIGKYVKACEECKAGGPSRANKANTQSHIQKNPKFEQIKVSHPFEIVGVDFIGPLTETSHGNKYIFTATDYYTKWIEAFPIQTKNVTEVGKCFEKIFSRHGLVNCVMTGQGREFINEVNEYICKRWSIQRCITTAYYNQMNFLNENTRHSLKQELCSKVVDHPTNWDMRVDSALYILRTKPDRTTKYSPFSLLYGRDVVRIPDQLTDNLVMLSGEPTDEELEAYVLQRQQTDTINMNRVYSNMDNSSAKQSADKKKRSQNKRKFELIKTDASQSLRDHIEMVSQNEGQKVWQL